VAATHAVKLLDARHSNR